MSAIVYAGFVTIVNVGFVPASWFYWTIPEYTGSVILNVDPYFIKDSKNVRERIQYFIIFADLDTTYAPKYLFDNIFSMAPKLFRLRSDP
jgi:hypothetical protein